MNNPIQSPITAVGGARIVADVLEHGRGWQELGAEYGRSGSRVRQVFHRHLRQLKHERFRAQLLSRNAGNMPEFLALITADGPVLTDLRPAYAKLTATERQNLHIVLDQIWPASAGS